MIFGVSCCVWYRFLFHSRSMTLCKLWPIWSYHNSWSRSIDWDWDLELIIANPVIILCSFSWALTQLSFFFKCVWNVDAYGLPGSWERKHGLRSCNGPSNPAHNAPNGYVLIKELNNKWRKGYAIVYSVAALVSCTVNLEIGHVLKEADNPY